MKIEAHVEGMEHLNDILTKVAPREAINILRGSVTKFAAGMRKEMKRQVPVRGGTLRRAISSRRTRGTRTYVEAVIYIKKGAASLYWHLVEFGSRFEQARPYITPVFEKSRDGFRKMFEDQFFKQLERVLSKR